MPADNLMTLEPSATQVATRQSAAFDLGRSDGSAPGAGTPEYGLVARFLVTACTSTTTNTAKFTIEHSQDNTNWEVCAGAAFSAADNIAATATGQTAVRYVPFMTRNRYIRAVCTVSGAGTISITYSCDVAPAFP